MSNSAANTESSGSSKKEQRSFEIGDLPTEVLSYIFEFVPYPFIHDVRLVCKNWYEIATRNKYLQDQEKVVCCENFASELLHTFLKSKKEILHLRLEGDPIPWKRNWEKVSKWNLSYTGNLEFWQRFGPELKSLSIRGCQFESYDDLLKIISHCTGLETLELSDFDVKISEHTCNNSRSAQIEKGFDVISNLEAMCIHVTGTEKYSEFFESFFNVLSEAPNLKSFGVEIKLGWLAHLVESAGADNQYLSPHHLAAFLPKFADRLYDLRIYALMAESYEVLDNIIKVPDLQIRSLSIDHDFPMELPLLLKSLEKLEICSSSIQDDKLKLICSELQELRCLKVSLSKDVSTCPFYLLPKLTTLSLKTRNIPRNKIDGLLVDGLCSKEDTILKEFNLKGLCSPDTIVQFAKTHPSLIRLCLQVYDGVTDSSVEAIFKYLVSLESLALPRSRITDAGLSGHTAARSHNTGYGISRLKNLWNLDLRYCAHIKGQPFCSGLTLPLLRHLHLDASSFSETALIALVKNHPRIENFKLLNGLLTKRLVETMADNLNRLRYVFSLNDQGSLQECVESLRKQCKLVAIQSKANIQDFIEPGLDVLTENYFLDLLEDFEYCYRDKVWEEDSD